MSSCLRRLKVVVATLAAVAASSAIAQTRTDPTLDRLAAEFQAAYNRGDVETAASFYAEDAVLMPPNRPMTLGLVAITAALRRNLESDPAKMQLRPTESAIAGGYAYEVGTRVMTWPSGTTLNEKYTRIFKRVRDEWKMVYFIWNSDSAAGPPR